MTRIKLCGITRLEDAELAASLGAWAVGFVFHRASPRYVAPGTVAAIVARLPREVRKVGVVVDRPLAELRELVAVSGVDTLQLHGAEDPALAAEVARFALPIKAIKPARAEEVDALAGFGGVDYFLVDAHVPGEHGGTGRLADRDLARKAASYGKLLLAGGLDPGNVAEAIRAVRPFAVDVSSGVEASPGIKDAGKVREFFAAVKETR